MSTTHPIYFTDDYPRTNCRLVVDVRADGYVLAVVEPGGKTIETYAPNTARQLARMIEEWCCGFAPRSVALLDQASCGSSSTVNA